MLPEIFHITPNNPTGEEIHAAVGKTARETFLTVSVLRRSVSSLGQDFELASQGVHAPSGWVSFYTSGFAHTQRSCHVGKVSACCLREVSTGIPKAKGD